MDRAAPQPVHARPWSVVSTEEQGGKEGTSRLASSVAVLPPRGGQFSAACGDLSQWRGYQAARMRQDIELQAGAGRGLATHVVAVSRS